MKQTQTILDLSNQALEINMLNENKLKSDIKNLFDNEMARIEYIARLKLGDHKFYEYLPDSILNIYLRIKDCIINDIQPNILEQFDNLFNAEVIALDSTNLSMHAYEFIDACCEVTRIKLELLIFYENYQENYMSVTGFTPIHAANLVEIFPKVKVGEEVNVFSERILHTNLNALKYLTGEPEFVRQEKEKDDSIIGLDILMSQDLMVDYTKIDFIYLNLDLLVYLDNDKKQEIFESVAKIYRHFPIVIKLQNTETYMYQYGFTNFNPKRLEKHIMKFSNVISYQIHRCLESFKQNAVSFVAPRIYRGAEFKWFKTKFHDITRSKDIALGMSFDHEYTASHQEEFQKYDFAVLECDLLFESYNDEIECNLGTFKTFYKEEMRELHYGIYRKRRRDFAYLGTINDKEIMTKLVNSGFKRFILNSQQLQSYYEVSDEHKRLKQAKEDTFTN